MEDYAEDREADIQRVQQMLQDVDEPDTPKEGKSYFVRRTSVCWKSNTQWLNLYSVHQGNLQW